MTMTKTDRFINEWGQMDKVDFFLKKGSFLMPLQQRKDQRSLYI